MRTTILAAALFAIAGAASAGQPASTSSAQSQAREGGRVVFVCDRTAESRRSFERDHGAPMQFVSAEELARAQAAKETWSTPRCITAAELQRYEAAAQSGRVMRARSN